MPNPNDVPDPTYWGEVLAGLGVAVATVAAFGKRAKKLLWNGAADEPEWARHIVEAMHQNTAAIQELRVDLERIHGETVGRIGDAMNGIRTELAVVKDRLR